MRPANAKRKGTKLERWVADQLASAGFRARRQPGSGVYDGFPHDAVFERRTRPYIVECKHWKHGWRTGDNAMGKADLLVIKRDYHPPAVYMSWEVFVSLISEEGDT